MIDTNPSFYNKFLSSSEQKKYGIDYINSLLSRENKDNLNENIVKVKLEDITQAISMFSALKKI